MTLNDRFKMSFRDNDEVKVEGKTLLLEDVRLTVLLFRFCLLHYFERKRKEHSFE